MQFSLFAVDKPTDQLVQWLFRTKASKINLFGKFLTLNLMSFNEWFGGCFKSKQLALEKSSEDKKQDALSRQ